MTKDQCAKMCDEKGCSAEEKKSCLSHYGEDGKWSENGSAKCETGKEKKDCCKGH
jgi:K(+)-stimulated pyrophosphate-energized sodium pump